MPSDAERKDRTSPSRWLEVALIFVVFFVAGGAPPPHVNDTHYLTKAKNYWQPDWCAGDLFLESADAHLVFYWTVGWLTKWFSLSAVAWIGRVVVWALLAVSWQRLSRCVVRIRFGSVLTAMLFVTLIRWTNFAGEWVIGSVEGKCFAYALVFWGLAALAEGRWRTAWPCFGFAGAFHVLVGGWSAIVAALVWLWQPKDQRPALLTMTPSLVLGAALALPGIVPALNLTLQSPPEVVAKANQVYVFDRLSHHLAPLNLNPAQLATKAGRFGLLVLGFAMLRMACFRMSSTDPRARKEQTSELHRLDLLMQFAVGALLLSIAGLAWEVATWNHPALAARILKYYVFRLADIALPMAVCLGVVWLAYNLSNQGQRLGRALLLSAVLASSWHLTSLTWTRYEHPAPPADLTKTKYPAAWREACQWVRENTSTDSLFLVPRNGQSFKWYAHRPDLITWKDVPQDAQALLVWQQRYYDVHTYINEFGERVTYRRLASPSPQQTGTQRIRQLGAKYAIDYVLAEDYPPLDLPIVYKNDWFTVYSMKQAASETPSTEH